MKTNMKVVRSDEKLTWTDRESGRAIFTADFSAIPGWDVVKTANPIAIEVFAYGVKQITADGMAGVSDREKPTKMGERFASIVSGARLAGRRASVAPMQHEFLFRALVEVTAGTEKPVADTPDNRAKFTKLPAATIGKLYTRPDIQKALEKYNGPAADEDFSDLLPDDVEVTDAETA